METNNENTVEKTESLSKTSNKKRIYILLALVGVFFCACLFWYYGYRVTLINDNIVVELGETVSSDPFDYLLGNKYSIALAKVNTHKVDAGISGTYPIEIRHFFDKFELEVSIEDTIAPIVTLNDSIIAITPYEELSAKDMISFVTDEDDNIMVSILVTSDGIISSDKSAIFFEKTGEYRASIKVTDSSLNQTLVEIPVIVDSKPQIILSGDYHVAADSDFSDSGYYMAYDEVDGDISEKVKSSFSKEYLKKPGNYRINYEVTDSYGLTSVESCMLYVYDPLQLQNQINIGLLSLDDDNVYGLINSRDTGYLLLSDSETAVSRIKPAIIRIHYETSWSRVNGSGYIVKVNDDNVIICTNRHVVGSQNKVMVSLYNGENVEGTVVASNKAPDIAFVKVNKSDILPETFDNLKTVHINYDYYKDLSMKPEFGMGMYCIYEDGTEWLTNYGKIIRKTGTLAQYFYGYDYPVTEVSVKLVPGVSGSAIVDSYGNLICMATYTWKHNGVNEYYGVSLDDILDFYEETFNERLEYY